MAIISKVITPNNNEYNIRAGAIPYGEVDSTSTSTAYTATVPGISELSDGVCVLLKNGVVTSAAGFTININGLGAKPSYSNMAAATAETTIFNINYTMLFIYDSTRVNGGCWICYRGYNANTDFSITTVHPSAVGTAIVGEAITEIPNYTPSGDIHLVNQDIQIVPSIVLDYQYRNYKLIINGLKVNKTIISVPTSANFVGNGVNFIIETGE